MCSYSNVLHIQCSKEQRTLTAVKTHSESDGDFFFSSFKEQMSSVWLLFPGKYHKLWETVAGKGDNHREDPQRVRMILMMVIRIENALDE